MITEIILNLSNTSYCHICQFYFSSFCLKAKFMLPLESPKCYLNWTKLRWSLALLTRINLATLSHLWLEINYSEITKFNEFLEENQPKYYFTIYVSLINFSYSVQDTVKFVSRHRQFWTMLEKMPQSVLIPQNGSKLRDKLNEWIELIN